MDKKSAKKLHFSPEIEQVARRQRTRESNKRFPIDPIPHQTIEIIESTPEGVEVEKRIIESRRCKINLVSHI